MTDIAIRRRPRRPHPRHRIPLPNGHTGEPRAEFAEHTLGITDRSARRFNFPTFYVGNVAYVDREASLEVVAEHITRRNQPPPRRRASS